MQHDQRNAQLVVKYLSIAAPSAGKNINVRMKD